MIPVQDQGKKNCVHAHHFAAERNKHWIVNISQAVKQQLQNDSSKSDPMCAHKGPNITEWLQA